MPGFEVGAVERRDPMCAIINRDQPSGLPAGFDGTIETTLTTFVVRFKGLQSWFPPALLRDCSVCFHNGIVEGPTGNGAYATEVGEDVGSVVSV